MRPPTKQYTVLQYVCLHCVELPWVKQLMFLPLKSQNDVSLSRKWTREKLFFSRPIGWLTDPLLSPFMYFLYVDLPLLLTNQPLTNEGCSSSFSYLLLSTNWRRRRRRTRDRGPHPCCTCFSSSASFHERERRGEKIEPPAHPSGGGGCS